MGLGSGINPLNAELNPICHLLVLLGAHPILHISRIRVNLRGVFNFTFFYEFFLGGVGGGNLLNLFMVNTSWVLW